MAHAMRVSRRSLIKGAAVAAAAGSMAACGTALAADEPNRVCEILGIEKPVVQALMFGMTNPELVAAVSEAGGLGVLAATTQEEIQAVKALASKPFAVSPSMADEDTIAMLKDEDISIVLTGTLQFPSADWAIDASGVKMWKDAGFTVLVKALNVTLDGALAIQEAGADILIPVGYGAGGCGPANRTAYPALLSQFRSQITIPMLAAGGIVDASTASAGKACGAEGAYCGTRFLATDESNACDAAKQAILDTCSEDLVDLPTSLGDDLFGYVPCVRTPMVEEALSMLTSGTPLSEVTAFDGTNAAFWVSMTAGNVDEYSVGMDRAVNLITAITPAADAVDEIGSVFVG